MTPNSCIDVSNLFVLCDFVNMPRLRDSYRNQIIASAVIIGELRPGIEPSEVAYRYHIHRSSVYRLINKVTKVVDHLRSGRPRDTDDREDHAMLKLNRRNQFRSAAETAKATIGHRGRRISAYNNNKKIKIINNHYFYIAPFPLFQLPEVLYILLLPY